MEDDGLETCREKITEILHVVTELRLTKQDKVKPMALIGILGTLIISIIVGAWNVSSSTANISNQVDHLSKDVNRLEETIDSKASDRYHAGTAERDFALRDTKLDYLDRRLSQIEKDHNRMGDDLLEHKNKKWHRAAGDKLIELQAGMAEVLKDHRAH